MKSNADAVKGWIKKGDSDLANVRMCLGGHDCLDTACFHAQQAAEKYIKAYLTAYEMDFPFIHNLEKLIELSATNDETFLGIKQMGESLTPYAVSLRYDQDFWPEEPTVEEALAAAERIRDFVIERLPEDMRP
jgi:HEPN domain-containing protein